MDGDGKYYDGAGFGKDPFQSLLKEHGNDNYIQNKWFLRDKILHLLDRKDNQSIIDEYSDTRSQDIIRVTIAQIACNKEYATEIRKNALSLLSTLRAINSYGLEEWARSQFPELLIRNHIFIVANSS